MKVSKFTASVIALAVSSAFAVQAEDNRYIIKLDNNRKEIKQSKDELRKKDAEVRQLIRSSYELLELTKRP